MSRIGIYGGSFNPVHKAHIEIAGCFYEQCNLDKILFIPAYNSPFKLRDDYINLDEHRIAMLKLATSKFNYFEVDDFEIRRGGISYTIDTIEYLKSRLNPADKLYLLIGSDQWLEFHRWKNWQQILKSVNICIAGRKVENQNINDEVLKFIKDNDFKVFNLDSPLIDISSQIIRYNIINGIDIKNLVDEDVQNYIIRNNLYLQ